MKRMIGIACMLSCCLANLASAQWPLAPLVAPKAENRSGPRHAPSMSASFGELQPTPAMWFYEQERKQYENPKAAVRANAEFRTSQRISRIAARDYYGVSASRPANVPAPAHSLITSPIAYDAVPCATVIVVPVEKPVGWR